MHSFLWRNTVPKKRRHRLDRAIGLVYHPQTSRSQSHGERQVHVLRGSFEHLYKVGHVCGHNHLRRSHGGAGGNRKRRRVLTRCKAGAGDRNEMGLVGQRQVALILGPHILGEIQHNVSCDGCLMSAVRPTRRMGHDLGGCSVLKQRRESVRHQRITVHHNLLTAGQTCWPLKRILRRVQKAVRVHVDHIRGPWQQLGPTQRRRHRCSAAGDESV
mmetsp:Transcript_55521/g.127691  ORF Transcript_55521/g.127691 Transcript_55521/m.127691 type:complete len:215 (-) Transcript_55521:502-1146(-)